METYIDSFGVERCDHCSEDINECSCVCTECGDGVMECSCDEGPTYPATPED